MGIGSRAEDVTDLMGSPVVLVGMWDPADDSHCMMDTAPGAIVEGDSHKSPYSVTGTRTV